jgi:succinoglycan biosynthesis protein ExoA
MNMAEPILAVIPCLNEEDHLERLVRQLAGTGLPMRIVVADGGSTDRSRQIAQDLAQRHSEVKFLENPQRVQEAAINRAVAAFGDGAEFLVRIDAHADYPDDYCRVLIEEAQKTGAESVTVAMRTAGKAPFQRAVTLAQNSRLGNGGSAHRLIGSEGQWVDHGHHALMRIKPFRAVGGYDEAFSHNEDAELDTRLRKAGYRIWLTGKTSVTYYPRAAVWPLFRQYMKHGYGRAQNILKHRERPKPRQLAPAAVLPALLLALFAPLWWIAALPAIIWAIFCMAYGFVLARDGGDMRLALAGPAAMIMHAGWSIGFWKAMVAGFWSRTT